MPLEVVVLIYSRISSSISSNISSIGSINISIPLILFILSETQHPKTHHPKPDPQVTREIYRTDFRTGTYNRDMLPHVAKDVDRLMATIPALDPALEAKIARVKHFTGQHLRWFLGRYVCEFYAGEGHPRPTVSFLCFLQNGLLS